MEIKTRFAPSPTGLMHFGSARASILPFLFAKHNQGKFFLRIDDTDVQRTKQEFVEQIFNDLKWLNIEYDYFFFQRDRKDLYDKHFQNLITHGLIYPCYDSTEEIESKRQIKRYSKQAPIYSFSDRKHTSGENPHWRFKLSDLPMQISDIIFGHITFNREWSDPVVKRADGTYCYVFCSVVDDIEENVSHIIRGAEHLSNAVIQQQIGDAILTKWKVQWAHFPMLLSANGEKLSKRNDSLSIKSLKDQGLESWTLFSFLSELGSNNKKIISYNTPDYSRDFSIENFSKVPKKFFEKELWQRNKLIFRKLPEHSIIERGFDTKTFELLKYNCNTWLEFLDMYNNLIEFKKSNKSIPQTDFYQAIFGKNSGPPITQIVDYLNE